MLTTTFALLHKYEACTERYAYLGRALGGISKYGRTRPISLLTILEKNGLDDALWALRACVPAEETERFARLLLCDYAEHVLPVAWDPVYPDDKRPHECIAVARRFAKGQATEKEFDTARAAAWAAWAAAWAVAWAARAAAWAARDAARDAAWAAWAAAWAARDARDAARDARDAEHQWQEERLRELLETGE